MGKRRNINEIYNLRNIKAEFCSDLLIYIFVDLVKQMIILRNVFCYCRFRMLSSDRCAISSIKCKFRNYVEIDSMHARAVNNVTAEISWIFQLSFSLFLSALQRIKDNSDIARCRQANISGCAISSRRVRIVVFVRARRLDWLRLQIYYLYRG